MAQLLSFTSILKYTGYILLAVVVLLIMVLIHELGHYVAGRILKFKINEFSVGFGPKIFQKKKKNGEIISLRAVPLGGYCAFEGESGDEKDNKQAFVNQAPWKRLIVLFFGAFFNFLSAIIFSFILLTCNGYDLIQVNTVSNSSINAEILYSGDVIYGIDNKKIDFVNDDFFSSLISDKANSLKKSYTQAELIANAEYSYKDKDNNVFYMDTNPIIFNIKRDKKTIAVDGYINLIYNSKGEYQGWSLLSTEDINDDEFNISTYKYTFIEGLQQAIPFTCKWAWKVLLIFGQLLTGKLALTSLGGPVTTINMIASYTQMSFSYLLLLLPLISVNLAVFNLLPIPALDGCQMLFVLIEWIRKKPLKQEVINVINNVGLIVLFGFVILVDILQFII